MAFAAAAFAVFAVALVRQVQGAALAESGSSVLRLASAESKSAEAPWFCHGIDCPAFTLDKTFTGVKGVERRKYAASKWVSVTVKGVSYDKAVTKGFESLFSYISGANQDSTKIPMTAPVRVRLIPAAGPTCENDFIISFFVPFEFQDATPKPTEDGVFLEAQEPFVVYSKSYGGFSSESSVIANAAGLGAALVDAGVGIEQDFYFSAAYDPPFRLFHRHNEVWIMEAAAPEL